LKIIFRWYCWWIVAVTDISLRSATRRPKIGSSHIQHYGQGDYKFKETSSICDRCHSRRPTTMAKEQIAIIMSAAFAKNPQKMHIPDVICRQSIVV
jgi:hypothetical protein